MSRVNTDILEISKLKRAGMGEFNSDDHYMYCCGQEPLRRNGVALIVNKRFRNAVTWVQAQNRQNDLCSFPTQTNQHHSNTNLCWSWTVLWRPTRPSRINTPQKCPFHLRGLEVGGKSRKSRDTWGNRQIWPWSIEWSKARANSFAKRMHWS